MEKGAAYESHKTRTAVFDAEVQAGDPAVPPAVCSIVEHPGWAVRLGQYQRRGGGSAAAPGHRVPAQSPQHFPEQPRLLQEGNRRGRQRDADVRGPGARRHADRGNPEGRRRFAV